MSTLERSFQIIHLLASSGEPCRFNVLLEKTSPIAPATLSKILKEMVSLGVIRESEQKEGYQLTGQLLDWGLASAPKSASLSDLCRDGMKTLHCDHSVTVSLIRRKDEFLVCPYAYYDMESPMMINMGDQRKLNLQGIGAVFLYGADELQNIKIEEHIQQDRCHCSSEQLQFLTSKALEDALFWDEGICYLGVGRIAVPIILDRETIVLACAFSPFRLQNSNFKNQLMSSITTLQSVLQKRLSNLWHGNF